MSFLEIEKTIAVLTAGFLFAFAMFLQGEYVAAAAAKEGSLPAREFYIAFPGLLVAVSFYFLAYASRQERA